MDLCPCGSGGAYEACCGALIETAKPAPTAEAVMRARYSAFVKQELEYLHDSLHPEHRDDYDPAATQRWARTAQWVGLEIVATDAGGTGDDEGTVEFIASYRDGGATHAHREIGRFSRHEGIWYYTNGDMVTPGTVRHSGPKVGRNDPCPCGSGRKYKKCCG